MDNTERISNISDTVHYLSEKLDKELRWIKNALKFLIDSTKSEKCKKNCDECECVHQPHYWNT